MEKRPEIRNLVPYKAIIWNLGDNEDLFSAEEFIESNPSVWEIESWNLNGNNKKIIITIQHD